MPFFTVLQNELPTPFLQSVPEKEHPEALFIEANHRDRIFEILHELPKMGLAIVGTRQPENKSLNRVQKVIHDLTPGKIMILSGLAKGIDQSAHENALDVGLTTVAFVAGGIEHPYPSQNFYLRRRIVDAGGLVISEYPGRTEPYPSQFLRRNRLIAGFSKATWVAEASLYSGSLNTASWANRFNREVFTTPCFPESNRYDGNQALLGAFSNQDYPLAYPLWSAKILLELFHGPTPSKPALTQEESLEASLRSVLSNSPKFPSQGD